MTSMYHSHPHHLSFAPNAANSSLLGGSMQANHHHSNLFNQTTSSSNNNSGCPANSASSMSNHLANGSHQQMTNGSSCNNLSGQDGSSSNNVTSNGAVAAAIAGYYNLQNNLSHQPHHHFTTTAALQPHYPSLFNPMLSNPIGGPVGNSIGNSIGNSAVPTSATNFVQYQNQVTNSSAGYLSNGHLNNLQHLNRQQTPTNGFHSNRYASTSNLMPISASSMLNGRLMFNDLNTNSVGGSNSTCSNSTINSLEETIIKKPAGKV